jgi:photosystem II stability/assembly factor-like uncharacterized protein
MKYRSIGPHRGGRVVAVSADSRDTNTYYFGTTGGGVWKTTDAGLTWRNLSDGYFKRASVGALAVSESDPNVIYAGMGETTIRSNVSRGDGVYKSTDAGKTWVHCGLEDTQNIGEVAIHPTNPDLVYVAAFGHVYGENAERGLYRSKDGGKSWERILFKSSKAGANEIAMDPTNPRILYVSFWEAFRSPYSMSSGGPDCSFYRSTDGGDTWEELTGKPGIPEGTKGKIGLTASAAKPGRVWALIEHEDGGVFRSDDYGDTWKRTSDDRNLRQRTWYYSHIYADPGDAETVWVLNVEMWKSIDGGNVFEAVPAPHGDNHDLWIDPKNPQRMILGNDGGGTVSTNGGVSWTTLYNQPTGEFYHVTVDNKTPYRVFGAQQDNTTMSIPSRSNNPAIVLPEWREIGGGESGYIAVRPDNPDIIYAGAMSGYLTRYDFDSDLVHDVSVWPEATTGAAKELKYRFQWTSPIHLSPHDSNVLYSGGNVLFRSNDEGSSWEPISHDLTRADPETLEASGGPITKDNTGAETYATIFAFAESPVERGVLWAGSDDGLVHVSRDNGASWQNVNPPDLPDWALISIIEASPHDGGTAYIAATRYKSHDDKPYLYKTNDYGATWTKIVNGIPEWDFTRVIREDPERRGLLVAGTETGVYVSGNDGEVWERLQLNLPLVPIHDLVITQGDLVVGTHGRSFWIIDDISPLRQMAGDIAEKRAHLFAPRDTIRFPGGRGFGHKPVPGKNYWFAGGMIPSYDLTVKPDGETEQHYLDAGNNPPNGVLVHYFLKEDAGEDLSLTFLTSDGQEIRTFKGKPQDSGEKKDEKDDDPKAPSAAGGQRFVWDMRHEGPTKISDGDPIEFPVAGPQVTPGEYRVRMTVGDETQEASFRIFPDPRLGASQSDYDAQFALLMKINGKLSETNEAIAKIRNIRKQSDAWAERIDDQKVKDAAKTLSEKLFDIEGELIQYKAKSIQDTLNFPIKLNAKLAGLAWTVSNAPGAPTRQSQELYDDLSSRVDQQIARLDDVVKSDVAEFNSLVEQAGVSAVSV